MRRPFVDSPPQEIAHGHIRAVIGAFVSVKVELSHMSRSHGLREIAGRLALAALLALGGGGRGAAHAPLDGDSAKPAFYATSAACAAARIFSKLECDNAFSSAFAEIQARRFTFSSRLDCIVQFHLCERQGQDGAYAPVVLGVEIVKGRGGGFVTPVLAVPTPQSLLPPQPIANPASSRESPFEPERAASRLVLLPTDHFERVDPSGVREAWKHFQRRELKDSRVFLSEETEKQRETPQQRRQRLQEAPFVE